MLAPSKVDTINENTWCLASVYPNPFRIWSFYPSEHEARQHMEIANHRQDACCYEPMLYGSYERAWREHALRPPMKEITEDQYYEALEVLPPTRWTRGEMDSFFMSEFWTGTYTTMYAKYRGRFYQKMVDFTDKTTWITLDMCMSREASREKDALIPA